MIEIILPIAAVVADDCGSGTCCGFFRPGCHLKTAHEGRGLAHGGYRKKPVVVEEFQGNAAWTTLRGLWNKRDVDPGAVFPEGVSQYQRAKGRLIISTLEGDRPSIGDWIIQGVKGELYPCKPDIFEATYYPVE